jgi:hypothetical protein
LKAENAEPSAVGARPENGSTSPVSSRMALKPAIRIRRSASKKKISPSRPHAAVQGHAQTEAQAQFPQLRALSPSAFTTQADLTEHPPENPQSRTIATPEKATND